MRRRQSRREESGQQTARLKEDKDLFLPPSLSHHTPAPTSVSKPDCRGHVHAIKTQADTPAVHKHTHMYAMHTCIHTDACTFIKSKTVAHMRRHTHTHTYALAAGQREFTMATGEWGSRM